MVMKIVKKLSSNPETSNNIILDKTCPGCKKLLINDKRFCECGFFLKSHKNSVFFGYIFSVWLVSVILILTGLSGFNKVKTYGLQAFHKNKTSVNSLSPLNVQIISSLKNTSYDSYIQSIYVKPDEKNKLIILIKPNLWNTLTKKEKEELINQVSINWKIIYKQRNPNLKQKPEVQFANN